MYDRLVFILSELRSISVFKAGKCDTIPWGNLPAGEWGEGNAGEEREDYNNASENRSHPGPRQRPVVERNTR